MTALKLILSNIARRPLRSLVTAGGVAVAVGTLFCLVSFERGYQNGLRSELDRLGAHILVVPKGCPYDAASIALHGASWPCYLKSAYIQTVRQTPHVAAAAPIFMSAVYDQTSGAQTVYCGTEPSILQLKRAWRIHGRFPNQPGDLLVGSAAAQTNRWALGETVSLPGIDGAKGRVSGIIGLTQGPDDLFIYTSMADARRLFHRPDQITHILVRLDQPESMDDVVHSLRGCDAGLEMNVVPLAHLFQTIETLIEGTRVLLGSVALVALLAAAAGVGNTVLMAVAERTREIGVLRAIGASRAGVFGLICAETVALCLIGGVAGIAFAALGSQAVEGFLRARLPFSPHDTMVRPEVVVALACTGGAILLGAAAGLLPAWRAARLSPVEAIKA